MNEDPRIELVRHAFARWEAGDAEGTMAFFDPEIEVFAPPEVGNPGTFHGIEGFLEWSRHWYEAWDSFRQELISVEAVGDRHALARSQQVGKGKGSGIEIERPATYVYEIRDGKATFMAIFFDHEKAVALAREREAAASA